MYICITAIQVCTLSRQFKTHLCEGRGKPLPSHKLYILKSHKKLLK